ncbi:MAG: hypothetical protein ACI845_000628 [Gammaproteobacteria bacterium]|jgi:hypothetical protein
MRIDLIDNVDGRDMSGKAAIFLQHLMSIIYGPPLDTLKGTRLEQNGKDSGKLYLVKRLCALRRASRRCIDKKGILEEAV